MSSVPDTSEMAVRILELCDDNGLDPHARVIACTTVIVHAIAHHMPQMMRENIAKVAASAIISGVDDAQLPDPMQSGRC